MNAIAQSFALAPHTCPCCHAVQNHAEGIERNQREPRAGDISICSNCAGLTFFRDALGHLRKATWGDIAELKKNGLWEKVSEQQQRVFFTNAASRPRHPFAARALPH